jgi:hypothetical protein
MFGNPSNSGERIDFAFGLMAGDYWELRVVEQGGAFGSR